MKKGVIIAGSGRGSAFAKGIIKDGCRRVVAMVDNNTEIHDALRRRFAEEYGSPETVIMGSLEEALARFPKSEADTVLIVTPNNTHAEMLRLTLEAGRHALLEKPVAANQEDLLKIAAITSGSESIIQLGFVLRFSPMFVKIKELIDTGRIGNVVMCQINEWLDFAHSALAYRRGWRSKHSLTGGFLNEKCSHDIDLLCHFKDGQAEAVRVYSVAGTQMFPQADTPENCDVCSDVKCPFSSENTFKPNPRYQLANDLKREQCVYHCETDIYNIQSVIITFSDGTQGILTLTSYSGEPGRTVYIHGTDGYIFCNMEKGELKYVNYHESGIELQTVPMNVTDDGHGGGDSHLLPELFSCIENNSKPRATVYDGLRASAIAFAADESAATGQAIDLRPVLNRLKE